jgi:hypothetical protein
VNPNPNKEPKMAEQLNLVLAPPSPNPGAPELSAWLRGKPPFVGWWDTRVILTKGVSLRVPLIERRWWSTAGWSAPVMHPEDEAAAHLAKHCLSSASWSLLEYRGLLSPAPEGYDWALDEHHRSNMAAASRARVQLLE